jgi:23S rRNA (uracil1939-C5)-methyltransferase
VLYDVVKSFMPEKKPALLYDLYCGTGTIGIYLSTQAEKIVGVEFVEDAVEDARRNCALNNIQHLSFYSGDMVKVLSEAFVEQEGKPEVIITDPPRAGMDEKICRKILSIGAENIIYVSCNPATQARDIKFLSEQYDMVKIQPVDMFPQTSHVETVALLRLRNV